MMNFTLMLLVSALLLVAGASGAAPAAHTVRVNRTDPIRIKLSSGQIVVANRKLVNVLAAQTLVSTSIVYEFLGLPFARPPVGSLRFQFPANLTSTLPASPYNATFARAACMQVPDSTFGDFSGSTMWNPPGEISEDCLYMNIWTAVTPAQDALFVAESAKTTVGYLGLDSGSSTSNQANTNLTTMVWIYGGSYNSGTASLAVYDGTAIAALEGVLVMAPNYRIGPLGFLYLKNSQAPGNAGLADIALSVEWLNQYYVPLFTDPARTPVTMFGESAGSGCLHDLLLSSKSHLFQRAIFESLSSYLPLAFREPSDAVSLSYQLAGLVNCTPAFSGCNYSSSVLEIDANRYCLTEQEMNEEVAACLLGVDAATLTNNQFSVTAVNRYLPMQFVPTLDYHQLLAVDPTKYDFATSSDALNKQILAGVNQDEGTYFTIYAFIFDSAQYFNLSSFSAKYTYNNKFVADRLNELLVTGSSNYDVNVQSASSTPGSPSYQLSGESLNQIYFRQLTDCLASVYTATNNELQETLGFDTNLDSTAAKRLNSPVHAWQKLSKIVGDVTFACPLIELANMYSRRYPNNTYFYKFNRRAASNPWPAWCGVMHGYEIPWVFGMPLLYPDEYPDEDRVLSQRMINYWANFARHGSLVSDFDSFHVDSFIEFDVSNSTYNEADRLARFQRQFTNCELINKLNAESRSYAVKYEICHQYLAQRSNTTFNGAAAVASPTGAVLLSFLLVLATLAVSHL